LPAELSASADRSRALPVRGQDHRALLYDAKEKVVRAPRRRQSRRVWLVLARQRDPAQVAIRRDLDSLKQMATSPTTACATTFTGASPRRSGSSSSKGGITDAGGGAQAEQGGGSRPPGAAPRWRGFTRTARRAPRHAARGPSPAAAPGRCGR
jgi:hypothetical protein